MVKGQENRGGRSNFLLKVKKSLKFLKIKGNKSIGELI